MRWSVALLLLLAACAAPPGSSRQDPASLRFMASLSEGRAATTDIGTELLAQSAQAAREAEAVAYATGRRARPDPAPDAVEAAGEVVGSAFDALLLHAAHLTSSGGASGSAAEAPPSQAIIRRAEAGLADLRAAGIVVPDPTRDRGLAGLAALVGTPSAGTDPAALAASRQEAVEAVVALMREVVGATPSRGLRGVVAAQEAEMDRSRTALLDAARRDRSLGVMDRYALFQAAAAAEDGPEPDEDLDDLLDMLERIPPAHAALAQPGEDGAARLAALEAAVVQLRASD